MNLVHNHAGFARSHRLDGETVEIAPGDNYLTDAQLEALKTHHVAQRLIDIDGGYEIVEGEAFLSQAVQKVTSGEMSINDLHPDAAKDVARRLTVEQKDQIDALISDARYSTVQAALRSQKAKLNSAEAQRRSRTTSKAAAGATQSSAGTSTAKRSAKPSEDEESQKNEDEKGNA